MAKGKPPAERQAFHFQFITTPTADTPGTSILLHFNSRRYIFGRVAEGTQRACIQRGVGIKKVRNIFLTGPTTWDNMGGLIGLILTMADVQAGEREEKPNGIAGRPKLNIHAGPKAWHAIACARRFVFRTGMPLSIYEAQMDDQKPLSQPDYSDENIDVWALPVRRTQSGMSSPILPNGRSASPDTVANEQALRRTTVTNMFDSEWRKDRLVESRFDEVKLPAVIWTRDPETKELSQSRCTKMTDAPHLSPDSKVLVRNPWPAAKVETLPPADNLPSSIAMSYIIRGQSQRGNFLPQRAKELGVKPGPAYARLAAGESITLDNGNIITSDMVLTPAEPGKCMAVLDVPTMDYLEDITSRIHKMKSEGILQDLEMISWLLGSGVFYATEFRDLVSSLPHAKHFVSSPDTSSNTITLESSAVSLLRLSQIRPDCFPEPICSNEVLEGSARGIPLQEFSYEPIRAGAVVHVQPKFSIDNKEVPAALDFKAVRNQYAKKLVDLLPVPQKPDKVTDHDNVEVITLGTGSAVPSKYRNVSATLLRIPELGNYLIDCGENTLGQLQRTFTQDELDDLLCDLRMIWISHLHADHHLGTLSMIVARNKALGKRGITDSNLYIVSEPNMADYLREYSSVQPCNNCVFLSCLNSVITENGNPLSIEQIPLYIKTLATTLVSHCHGAQAVSITFENGFKFSYSGDCRPSSRFAEIGADSDILLHEATFDDGMEGDAKAKKHCTTAEALGVAVKMRAKHLILTHFSQRYQKLPGLNNMHFAEHVAFEEGNEQDDGPMDGAIENTIETATLTLDDPLSLTQNAGALTELAARLHICVAFDQMRVKLPHIRDMYQYYPAIEKMFELERLQSDFMKTETAALKSQQTQDNKNKQKKKTTVNGGGKTPGEKGDHSQSTTHVQIHGQSDGQTGTNTPNEEGSSVTTDQPPLSKSALKRLLHKQEKKRERENARNDRAAATAAAVGGGGSVVVERDSGKTNTIRPENNSSANELDKTNNLSHNLPIEEKEEEAEDQSHESRSRKRQKTHDLNPNISSI